MYNFRSKCEYLGASQAVRSVVSTDSVLFILFLIRANSTNGILCYEQGDQSCDMIARNLLFCRGHFLNNV